MTYTQYMIILRNSRNAIPNISSEPNGTNKKTITDSLITPHDTL